MVQRKCEICLEKQRDKANVKKQMEKHKERTYCVNCYNKHKDFIKGKVGVLTKGLIENESK